tara:strand:- start:45 stop:320 length:276 start_codon:yes stop_codon:yes gene_type:complete
MSSISNYVGKWHAHQHLFLPKDYSGSPTASIYTPWTESEVHSHLTTGWSEGAITELKLEYLYGPEPSNYVPLSNRVSGTGVFIFMAWYGIL